MAGKIIANNNQKINATKLPQTGENNNNSLSMLGVLLATSGLIMGMFGLARKPRKK